MIQSSDGDNQQTVTETLKMFEVGIEQGLMKAEAGQHLQQYGYNAIDEKEESLGHCIFCRFWGPIPWMIEVAALLSAMVQKWEGFSIIMVLHEGVFNRISARKRVPADVQLLSGDYLLIDQAALTGESLPVSRKINEVAHVNTIVKQGKMLAVVINTGSGGQELLALVAAMASAIYERLNHDVRHAQSRQFADEVMESVKRLYDTRLLDCEFIHARESAIIEMIEDADLFAEVVPEDKDLIVETLQKGGHIVAMTGDGVNDAPALKKADCGFAVSNATGAARAVADIILIAPGLSVINDAIKQARITFEWMKSYSIYRIAETTRIILLMTLAIVVFNFYPITALMIDETAG